MKKLLLSFSALLALSACVSQDQADTKMEKGCKAGVESLIKPETLTNIKSVNLSNEKTVDGLHRRVTINATAKDGWLEIDKTYSCLFAQQWGLFKSNHLAILVQVKLPSGRIVGKEGGMIKGEIADYLSLTKTVETAMGQN